MRPSSLLRLTAAAGATAAVLAAPPTTLAADAVYGGMTADSDPIVITADKDGQQLRSLGISWMANCGNSTGFADSAQLTPAEEAPGFHATGNELIVTRNAKGRFSGSRLSTRDLGDMVAGVVTTIEGTLKPAKASGTLSAKVTLVEKATGNVAGSCTLGKRSWKATRAPGVVYGGSTSQGEPVVLRLNAARRAVDDLVFAWEASCTPDGGFRFREDFYNWKVKSTGAFGGPIADDVTLAAGGNRHFDYSVAGRVGATKANGTLSARFGDVDAAGTQGRMCDTGKVTWKATTG